MILICKCRENSKNYNFNKLIFKGTVITDYTYSILGDISCIL